MCVSVCMAQREKETKSERHTKMPTCRFCSFSKHPSSPLLLADDVDKVGVDGLTSEMLSCPYSPVQPSQLADLIVTVVDCSAPQESLPLFTVFEITSIS